MDVPGRQVLYDASAFVLMLDTHGVVRSDKQARMAAAPDLNAGLLISAQHVLIRPEWLALPAALVQVEDWTGEFQEACIARKDPGAIAPRAQCIVRQDAPNGAARGRDFVGVEPISNFDRQFAEAITTQRNLAIGRTFACHGHNQPTRGGGGPQVATAARPILKPIAPLTHKAGEPTAGGPPAHVLPARPRAAAPTGRPAQRHR